MKIIKFIAIFLCFMLFLLCASLVHIFVTVCKPAVRWLILGRLTRVLIRSLQRIVGIAITVDGDSHRLRNHGQCIISRHVGYIDGLVLGGLCAGSFISKKEIQQWPVIGLVIELSGTIFIDRQRKNRLADSLAVIERRLRRGIDIVLFPEGTSSDGRKLLPFQTAFFQPLLTAGATVVPVTIVYRRIDGQAVTEDTKDGLFWYGDMSFFTHLWKLLGFQRIDVTVTVHDAIEAADYPDTSAGRKALSRRAYEVLAAGAGITTEAATCA